MCDGQSRRCVAGHVVHFPQRHREIHAALLKRIEQMQGAVQMYTVYSSSSVPFGVGHSTRAYTDY